MTEAKEAKRRPLIDGATVRAAIDAKLAAAPEGELGELLEQGYACLERGDAERADPLLQRLESLAPMHREVLLFTSHFALMEGDAEDALAAVDQVLTQHPDDLLALSTRAEILLEGDGDLGEALLILEEMCARVREVSVTEGDDYDDAADAALNDLLAQLHLQLSELLLALDDPAGAADAAEQALDAQPGAPDAWLALAWARATGGELSMARDALREAERVDEALAGVAHLRGAIALIEGADEESAAQFARAAELEPGSYAIPVRVTRDLFEEQLGHVIAGLPDPFGAWVQRAAVELRDAPEPFSRRPFAPVEVQGAPPDSGSDPFEAAAEKIVLFQRNIELIADDEEEIPSAIEAALIEAAASFLDLDDDS